MTRFADPGTSLRELIDDVLATCPSCGACVRVTAHRAACGACAWSGESDGGSYVLGHAFDPWLRLPLWLVTTVRGETLWAYNARHLDLLAGYVAAGLRERDTTPGLPMSVAERLPAWVKSAKNRDAVLAGIERLRERLAEA